MSVRTGAVYSLAHNWRRGHRTPGPEWRAILRNLYGIPEASWDEIVPVRALSKKTGQGGLLAKVVNSPAPVAQPERAPACTGDDSSSNLDGGDGGQVPPAELAQALTRRIHAIRRDLDNDPTRTLELRIKAEQACTNMLRQIFALTGEDGSVSDEKLVQTPAFRRALGALMSATAACGKCSAAIAGALEALE